MLAALLALDPAHEESDGLQSQAVSEREKGEVLCFYPYP